MKLKWDPNLLGWKYLNYILIVMGLIVGVGVWLVPNKWNEPEIAASMAEQHELRDLRRQRLAREADEKRIQDELGLIYITPESNPFKPVPAEPKKE